MRLDSHRIAVLLGIVMSLTLFLGCGGGEKKQDLSPEQVPEILDMPAQKMAVVYTKGDPTFAGAKAVPALHASVSALLPQLKEKGINFELQVVRARWPDMNSLPRNQWTGIWGLPIPEEVDSLPQNTLGTQVEIEVWNYGKVAQILHIGHYTTEGATIEYLMDFIAKSGYQVAGSHEKIYLTPPNAEELRTIILYPIKKK